MFPVQYFLVLQGRKHSFIELSELPLQGSPDILNRNLTYVNKLREYWHRGQNALVIDDQVACSLVFLSSLLLCSVYVYDASHIMTSILCLKKIKVGYVCVRL